ncbi:MAG: hypothetical protein Q7K45_07405 [Nanoarchaeota archaeon]|nr:hypothetical protein [Nanoarchaeota archaeon]
MFEKTWETIVEPVQPIPLSELELKITEGDAFTLGQKRPQLYAEVLQYWDKKQVEMTLARAKTLAAALMQQDTPVVERMQKQIGGVEPKHSLSRAVLDGKKLYLAMNSVNFMDFAGTNIRAIEDTEFRTRLMQAGLEDYADSNRYFANPLAVCSVVYGYSGERGDISHAYALILKRSDKVAIYPNVHHVNGGLADIDKNRTKIDIGLQVYKELHEELGIDNEHLGNPTFHGIVRQIPSRTPEAICSIPVYLPQQELERRWREKAPAKFEHGGMNFYPLQEVPAFLDQYGSSMVPSGQAALMYLLQQHGIAVETKPMELQETG